MAAAAAAGAPRRAWPLPRLRASCARRLAELNEKKEPRNGEDRAWLPTSLDPAGFSRVPEPGSPRAHCIRAARELRKDERTERRPRDNVYTSVAPIPVLRRKQCVLRVYAFKH
ncbi:hypothetical protein MRX96_050055 [Rhipicephalus microplus]